MRSRIYLLVAIILGLAVFLGLSQIFAKPYQFQGSLIEPPQPAPDFTLTNQDKDAFSLSSQRGNIILLFFGYTNCPDVCPITMADFRDIINTLGKQVNHVRFVFVTVDPERDTPAVLKSYLGFFSPNIIGLSGGQAALKAVWNAYGILVIKQPGEGDSNNYAVDHTARIFLIDQEGNMRLTYPVGFEKERIVSDIRYLLGDAR